MRPDIFVSKVFIGLKKAGRFLRAGFFAASLLAASALAQTLDFAPGDIRLVGDFDGDGQLDYGAFRPSNGTWYLYQSSNPGVVVQQQWGLPGDIPVPADYDGDGKTDYAIWRPSNGTWWVIPSSTGSPYPTQWGLPGDIPVVGDFDGDGKSDTAIWRPSEATWYIIESSTGFAYAQQFGFTGDVPVVGDYDGDGKTDVAVWRPSEGNWYVLPSSTDDPYVQQWGLPGDIPFVGNFDGDIRTDYAVWRPSDKTLYVLPSLTGDPYTQQVHSVTALLSTKFSVGTLGSGVYLMLNGDYNGDGIVDFALFSLSNQTWFISQNGSTAAPSYVQWGLPGDVPVPGDYDGKGITDVAVWRPSDGTWFVISSSANGPYSQQWGLPGDIPVPGDYDGDGKADLAIWRPSEGNWYVVPSSTGTPFVITWGAPGDSPVTGDYDGDGKTDLAVWRPADGTWIVLPSSTDNGYSEQWGLPGDAPLVGDFDGDGITDLAIWRPSQANEFIIPSSDPTFPRVTQFSLGIYSKSYSQLHRLSLAIQYCISGAVTGTSGFNGFQVGEPVAITAAVTEPTSCRSATNGGVTLTACSSNLTLNITTGNSQWTSSGTLPSIYGRMSASVQTLLASQTSTTTFDLQGVLLNPAQSPTQSLLSVNFEFIVPTNLFPGGNPPATLPTPAALAGQAIFTLLLDTTPSEASAATISYTGEECATAPSIRRREPGFLTEEVAKSQPIWRKHKYQQTF